MSHLTHHFICRPLAYCLSGLLLLSGCQSVALSGSDKTVAKPLNNEQAFLAYNHTSAKADLIRAMDSHLASERVVLTDYYQKRSTISKHALDTGDGALLSILKTYFYKTLGEQTQVDAMDDGEVHLRYYDKQAGTLPDLDYTLTHAEATTPAMTHTNKEIHDMARQYRACVTEFSYDVDSLLKANPVLTADSRAFQDRQKRFNQCLNKTQKYYQGIDDGVSAYQQADLHLIRQCAATYQKNLNQALAKSRQLNRYDEANFDVYESVYGNFAVCHAEFEMGHRLDPANEDERVSTKNALQMTHETRLCAIANAEAQDKLQKQGKTYANDPQAYASVFYEYFGCLGGKYSKVYDGTDGSPIGSPTTLAEAEEVFELHQELLADYEDEAQDEATPLSWLSAYFDMKTQEQNNSDNKSDLDKMSTDEFFGWMLSLQATPEQVHAYNLYYANNARTTTLSHHIPNSRTVSSVLAMEFDAPTVSYRLNLPFLADFNEGSLSADMSPIWLAMALLYPEQTPILTDNTGKVGLPKELQKIPLSVVYDSVQAGYKNGLMAFDESVFSQLEPKSAPFADQFSADKVIKLNLTAKQKGQLLGVILKQLQKDLSAYIDNHPQTFDPEQQATQTLKAHLAKWAMLNDGYHVGDVGRVLQLIESILPLELSQTHHYYFKAGKLVGQVAKIDVGASLTGVQDEMLAVSSYHSSAIHHRLTKHLMSQKTAGQANFDVNDWFLTVRQSHDNQQQAEAARQSYLFDESTACEMADCQGETDGAN